MKIIGIGIDLVEINRIKNIFQHFKKRFVYKILTRYELSIYKKNKNKDKKIKILAKYFSVKEAAVKALNTGFTNGIFFNQIELLHYKTGKPRLKFYSKALKIIKNITNNYYIHISISDEINYTCAIVIIEKI
ncbi:holo-ACP synthase [Enterobacteriaceae endosymbiont of Donacia versicolorea]|uniref:holo-ACP synthase n=1 Tax=Enterobacteriaceae endosymbiont of Donacia versicolorea TaxID=2675788 RepID=UPI001449A74D|nr:holo-ACP synthase [Enterobacteriaceae endosymbiont of Donacia versicolorea]QJC32033.1 holo-ACP synthase [Enterobacteriaceae endosymbiont of Donacia versicolorea]